MIVNNNSYEIEIEIHASLYTSPIYNKEDGWLDVRILRCIVTNNGTVSGDNSVDIQFIDKNGNKYVAILPAKTINEINIAAQTKLDDAVRTMKEDVNILKQQTRLLSEAEIQEINISATKSCRDDK